ncbi:alpha/beta hydrolase [Kribbella sp. NPDC051770]|uniref:alpha/beta hydrolase n=1 Tax=Kribbella sp. NPDC051770 TaxID=3155413 RepID=UPI00342240FC
MVIKGLLALGLIGAGLLPAVPSNAARIDWKPCEEGQPAECARLTVPLDYAKPGKGKTELLIARVPARDQAHKLGVLTFNPGGPGGPGASMLAAGIVGDLFGEELRDRFDVVSFDPRGTGGSSQLDCGPVLRPGVPVFPDSKRSYDAMVAASRELGKACLAKNGDLMRHLDTRTAARDLDSVRAALGVRKLSYFGPSYGSYLGATYAQLFPHRIDRMVLDGIVDHSQGSTGFVLSEAREMERGFDRMAAWCAATPECALHGRDVGKVFDAVVRKADRRPLPAGSTTVNGDQIRMALPMFLPTLGGFEGPWTAFASALAKASDAGDGSGFVGNSYVGFPESAYAAVSCMDFPGEFRGYADVRARLAVARAVAPRVGAAVEGWVMAAACSGWPIPPTNPWKPTPIKDAPPVLILNNTHDPATPLAGAISLQRQIRGSRLLVSDTYGHTSWFNNECARNHASTYFLTGKLPARGTTC